MRDLRGNVPTRVDKLRKGEYDAIVLAKAGLNRLDIDLKEFHVVDLSPHVFIPAPAQGALGLQVREKDDFLKEQLKSLNDTILLIVFILNEQSLINWEVDVTLLLVPIVIWIIWGTVRFGQLQPMK